MIAEGSPLQMQNDLGILWENYAIMERLKYQNYTGRLTYNYFWRTYDKQEIDWIENREGNLFAYEMKWSEKKVKSPIAWRKSYPDAHFELISPENYLDWVSD